MSITINECSATPQQVYNLTLAFQRTLHLGLPGQITKTPTVTVAGSCLGWTSPSLRPGHARALLEEYDRLERGVFGGPTADPNRDVPLVDVGNVIANLLSDEGENAEYDRACIEIAADLGLKIVANTA